MEITEAMVVMITVDMVDTETMVIIVVSSLVCGVLLLTLLFILVISGVMSVYCICWYELCVSTGKVVVCVFVKG